MSQINLCTNNRSISEVQNNHSFLGNPRLHVEIIQAHNSQLQKTELIAYVDEFLKSEKVLQPETVVKQDGISPAFKDHIVKVRICEISPSKLKHSVDITSIEKSYHVYKLDLEGPSIEDLGGGNEDDVPAAEHWLLPSSEFQNTWDTLIFDTDIKEQLLSFVSTTLFFSDHGVSSDVISWNRVVLLHGPPGTGKTSLCKALAQKVSIRLNQRYKYGQLFEVNSHSLFSKWFSESGKLVQKLFSKVMELVEDPESLVCVLIDEVESLTRMRAATANGADPSDALRVVNALLTQLDQIKRYPNVLILTTSNVTGTIDLAFVDRADIKQYIGLPSQEAIYQIYLSCMEELMNTNIIVPRCHLLSLRQLQITNMTENQTTKPSLILWKIAGESLGLSGRALRKIPFLAHAIHSSGGACTLIQYLEAMSAAVHKHQTDAAQLNET